MDRGSAGKALSALIPLLTVIYMVAPLHAVELTSGQGYRAEHFLHRPEHHPKYKHSFRLGDRVRDISDKDKPKPVPLKKSRLRCIGPKDCEFCYNLTIQALIQDFSYADDLVASEQVELLETTLANDGKEAEVKTFAFDIPVSHTYSWAFNENLDFLEVTFFNPAYPNPPPFCLKQESFLYFGGPPRREKVTLMQLVDYKGELGVLIQPHEEKNVSVVALKTLKRRQVRFDATITFLTSPNGACIQCEDQNWICYDLFPSTFGVREILEEEGFRGEILSEDDFEGIVAAIKGSFSGDYGTGFDYRVRGSGDYCSAN